MVTNVNTLNAPIVNTSMVTNVNTLNAPIVNTSTVTNVNTLNVPIVNTSTVTNVNTFNVPIVNTLTVTNVNTLNVSIVNALTVTSVNTRDYGRTKAPNCLLFPCVVKPRFIWRFSRHWVVKGQGYAEHTFAGLITLSSVLEQFHNVYHC